MVSSRPSALNQIPRGDPSNDHLLESSTGRTGSRLRSVFSGVGPGNSESKTEVQIRITNCIETVSRKVADLKECERLASAEQQKQILQITKAIQEGTASRE